MEGGVVLGMGGRGLLLGLVHVTYLGCGFSEISAYKLSPLLSLSSKSMSM